MADCWRTLLMQSPAALVALQAALVSACSLATLGCGDGRPPIAPVNVTVTYKSKPVSDAQVLFTSPEGRAARGTTDVYGRCSLTTVTKGDGAYEGEHLVAMTKHVEVPPHQQSPDFRQGGRLSRYPELKNLLPPKYASPIQSPLKAVVVANTENSFTFDLKD